MNTTTNGYACPVAFVTKSRQRLKQHTDTVYLNNGDEFEIEIFNPTQNKVLAKIELNGKSLGSGIVLRPGERVFLERYFDVAKKFLFETYKVSGGNDEVKKAIENNGGVTVKFFSEYVRPNPYVLLNSRPYSQGIYNSPSTFGGYNAGTTYSTNTLGLGTLTTSASSGTLTTSGGSITTCDFLSDSTPTNSFYSSTVEVRNKPIKKSKLTRSIKKEVETGRIEQGSSSDQSFSYDNTTFNSYQSWVSTWKILPLSQMVLVKEDLKVFCTECGAKRKKDNYRYCPTCGTKY